MQIWMRVLIGTTLAMKTIISLYNCCIQVALLRETWRVEMRPAPDERRDVESTVARLPSTATTTTTSGRLSSSSSYFWRSPVGLDHHTPWWGWLYGGGPPPAPFMGASRRVVTLPNFTTWSNDTEQIPLGITLFPRACVFTRDRIPALGAVLLR